MNLELLLYRLDVSARTVQCGSCFLTRCWHHVSLTMEASMVAGIRQCRCGCSAVYVWPVGADSPVPENYLKVEPMPNSDEVECDRCSTVVDRFDSAPVTINGATQRWCDSCDERFTEQCENCSRYYPEDSEEIESVNFGSWNTRGLCELCRIDIGVIQCGTCTELTNPNNPCHSECDEDCECEDHLESGNGVIHSYSYRPPFTFHGDVTRTRQNRFGEAYDATAYMGWELEVECMRDGRLHQTASKVQQTLGDFVFLKSDSSIDYGFEIVSHPATHRYWMDKFNWAGIRELRKNDIGTSRSCGLHIHVSRNGFDNPSHEYRWLLFWYRNEVIMKALAHRDADYFAPFHPSSRSAFRHTAKRGVPATGHYAAINSENEMTYEVRVFASTLYVDRLKAALSLVAATVEYTRELRAKKIMEDGGMKWPSFVAWLKPRTAQYPHLMEEIAKVVKPAMVRQMATTSWEMATVPGDWRSRQALMSGGYYGRQVTQMRTLDVVTQEAYGLVDSAVSNYSN